MPFTATVSPCHPLKQLVTALKELLTDCVIEYSPNGMSLKAMDSSHVSLCTFRLAPSWFAAFDCTTNDTCRLGMSLPTLDKLLQCAHRDDTVTMSVESVGDRFPDVLHLTMHPPTTPTTRTTQFEMMLLDIDADAIGVPGTADYTADIRMPSGMLVKVCKDLSVVGDTCVIRCVGGDTSGGAGGGGGGGGGGAGGSQIGFGVVGDTGKGLVVLEHEGGPAPTPHPAPHPTPHPTATPSAHPVTITFSEHASATHPTTTRIEQTFSLRFLTLFAKFAPMSEVVVLNMDEEAPLRVTFGLEGGGGSWVRLYLAPKVGEMD